MHLNIVLPGTWCDDGIDKMSRLWKINIRKFLNKDNEKEILKLCCEFADCKFQSIDKMLKDNTFYAETYYTEDTGKS